MGDFMSYNKLDVWIESRKLTNEIYSLSKLFPKEEVYGLSSQMRRSAVSVPSNIAEGVGRNHVKDSLQFFYIARGSLFELETQLYVAFDQSYLEEPSLKSTLELITSCKKLLNGFIKYHKSKL